MLKTTTTLALMGSVTATVDVAKKPNVHDIINKNSGFNFLHKAVTTKGTVASADQLGSTAAVAGTWLTATQDNSCSASTPAGVHGAVMGYCAANDNNGGTTTYAKYTCTEDTSTNTVVVSYTTYTDAACSTGAAVQTPVSFSTTCTNGEAYNCPASSQADTASGYGNGGVYYEAYGSASACSGGSSSDLVLYSGIKGCFDYVKYDDDDMFLYANEDCSGDALGTLSYAEIFPPACSTTSDDDDDDDDLIVYDQLYETYSWNDDDDDDVCFHVESKIDYKGVEYTYEELKAGKEPECTVPHSPSSKGVVISTSCDKTVRVTDTHLMATTKGFQLAYSLKAGDVLFGDYGSDKCTVKSVEKEKTTQQYFGLNCVHSEVLASGLRASTFGDFHTLPSWYMTYVGGLVGSETASSLGGFIAEWYFQK